MHRPLAEALSHNPWLILWEIRISRARAVIGWARRDQLKGGLLQGTGLVRAPWWVASRSPLRRHRLRQRVARLCQLGECAFSIERPIFSRGCSAPARSHS